MLRINDKKVILSVSLITIAYSKSSREAALCLHWASWRPGTNAEIWGLISRTYQQTVITSLSVILSVLNLNACIVINSFKTSLFSPGYTIFYKFPYQSEMIRNDQLQKLSLSNLQQIIS